jgi:hypothetical protein
MAPGACRAAGPVRAPAGSGIRPPRPRRRAATRPRRADRGRPSQADRERPPARRRADRAPLKHRFHVLPAGWSHESRLSSRYSQARAAAHSRFTVAGETSSTAAVSSMERPPKKRNSMTRLCCGSSVASVPRASSRATRSRSRGGGVEGVVDGEVRGSGAAFGGLVRARVIHQNAPDHLRGDAEEVRAVLPLDTALVDQAQIGFMHQGGRLQGVVGPLAPQIPRGKAAEFIVDNGRELLERLLLALAPIRQQLGDVGRHAGGTGRGGFCLRGGGSLFRGGPNPGSRDRPRRRGAQLGETLPAACASIPGKPCYTESLRKIESAMKRTLLFVLAAAVSLAPLAAQDFVTGQAARLVVGQKPFTDQNPESSASVLGAVGGVAFANGRWSWPIPMASAPPGQPPRDGLSRPARFRARHPRRNPADRRRALPGLPQGGVECSGPTDFEPPKEIRPAAQNSLRRPVGVAYNGRMLAVADTDNNRVLVWRLCPPPMKPRPISSSVRRTSRPSPPTSPAPPAPKPSACPRASGSTPMTASGSPIPVTTASSITAPSPRTARRRASRSARPTPVPTTRPRSSPMTSKSGPTRCSARCPSPPTAPACSSPTSP